MPVRSRNKVTREAGSAEDHGGGCPRRAAALGHECHVGLDIPHEAMGHDLATRRSALTGQSILREVSANQATLNR